MRSAGEIFCRQCGEGYLEPRLDMTKWEYDLFMAGSGCPCCEGHPDKKWELAEDGSDVHLAAANGDGDPIDRLSLFDPTYTPPKWGRPADPVLWTCAGCGVKVVRSVDDGKLEYVVDYGTKAHSWYISHDFRNEEAEEAPAHVFKPDQPVCNLCLQTCKGCGAEVCSTLDYGDCYDDGYCSTLTNYGCGCDDVYCIECIESCCSTCENLPEDCTCCTSCGAEEGCCECNEESDEDEECDND